MKKLMLFCCQDVTGIKSFCACMMNIPKRSAKDKTCNNATCNLYHAIQVNIDQLILKIDENNHGHCWINLRHTHK